MILKRREWYSGLVGFFTNNETAQMGIFSALIFISCHWPFKGGYMLRKRHYSSLSDKLKGFVN